VRVFPYANWLSDLYGSGMGCSRRLANDDPDLVRGFNTATMRGLAYAVEHPAEAGQIMAEQVDGVEPEQAVAELRVLADYVQPSVEVTGATLALGAMSTARLARHVALLESIGAVAAGFDFADVALFDLVTA
jgi:NitT/TauT family transport system substrate-binding protein